MAAAVLLLGCSGPSDTPSTATSEFSRHYRQGDERSLMMAGREQTLGSSHQRVTERIALMEKQLAETSDEDAIDDLEDELEVLEYVKSRLEQASQDGSTAAERRMVNVQSERILNLIEEGEARNGRGRRIAAAIRGFVPTSTVGHRIPAYPERLRSRPIGIRQARKESSFLYDPRRKTHYAAEELALMTPDEVSRLDVSPWHTMWNPAASGGGETLSNFEAWMQQGVVAALRDDDNQAGAEGWDIRKTRRVLFMDEVYKSATSAKATTKDAYGVEWKIKWGDECQSEPVSSRLYLLAGARITDLVYAGGGGPTQNLLVLAPAGEYTREGDEAKEERKPSTVEELAEALDDFYGFDIHPYIHSHGVIDRSNVDRLLHHLPSDGDKEYRRAGLIGRRWVSFKEYSVELKPKGFIRTVSGATNSDFGATEDRAARGLYLFSLWLSARDSKDDNSKSYFVKQPDGGGSKMKIVEHYDGYHDLGVSLGSMGSAAHLNGMMIGDDFLRRAGKVIKGRQTFIYRPRAYTNATWSDAKWMADRIAGLTDEQLRGAIASSTWPDFMKETMFFKIAARRDQIANLFRDQGAPPRERIAPPNFAVDLSSPDKVREVERRYRLSPGSLAEELASRGGAAAGTEILVKEGEIMDSRDSALITQLSIQHYPSGLADRYKRMANRNPEALEE